MFVLLLVQMITGPNWLPATAATDHQQHTNATSQRRRLLNRALQLCLTNHKQQIGLHVPAYTRGQWILWSKCSWHHCGHSGRLICIWAFPLQIGLPVDSFPNSRRWTPICLVLLWRRSRRKSAWFIEVFSGPIHSPTSRTIQGANVSIFW